jgi:hypothetical protein
MASNIDAGQVCTSSPTCEAAELLADDDYANCSHCAFSSTANPAACTTERSVNACCAWIEQPTAVLTRAVGLHEYSSTNPAPDFSCLALPAAAEAGVEADSGTEGASTGAGGGAEAGTPQTSTFEGYVKIFSSLPSVAGTIGVKVQIFSVDASGLPMIASPLGSYVTSTSDVYETNDWLQACADGCSFRHYQIQIQGIPVGTPLVIQTSDATGTPATWANLYEYNIPFISSACAQDGGGPCFRYDVTAVTPADIQALAPFRLDPSAGVLVGEVHDCSDIRISGANVDTDQAHAGSMLYFSNEEPNPLPDYLLSSENLGTSELGRFVAFNLTPGVPIRVSAIGNLDCQDTLLGTNVVQAFSGSSGPSMTWITMRGRAPYQTATSSSGVTP